MLLKTGQVLTRGRSRSGSKQLLAKHGRYLAYADLPACNEDEHRLAMDSEPRALASSPAESSDLVEPTWMHQPRAMAQRMVDATNRTMKREHDHDPSCES